MPKYNIADVLYYVNPFVFIIDKVQITDLLYEDNKLYYIDHSGAYLAEWDLYEDLDAATHHAINMLSKFYNTKMQELMTRREPPLEGMDGIWN